MTAFSAESGATLVCRGPRVVVVASYATADRVRALQAARGVSKECALVFIAESAERGAVLALARRRKVLL